MGKQTRAASRRKRHRRVRSRVQGTGERPRLSVFRSLKHMRAQIIDDERGHTLAAASTLDPDLQPLLKGKNKKDQARLVGETVAERAKAHRVNKVVFDRGGYRYHGRVRSLAEGARSGGLEF